MLKIIRSLVYLFISTYFITVSVNAKDQWRVVDNDAPEKGISAELYLKKGIYADERFVAYSGNDGYALPTFQCDELDTLKVMPGLNSGYFRFEGYCLKTDKTIRLQKVRPLANLVFNAKQKLDNKEYGDAALALREASERMRHLNFDQELVTSFSNSSVLSTASAVNATGAITAGTRGIQLTENVRERIASFQASENINTGEDIGQPTYSTIRALAKETPWDLMSNVPELDSSTLEILESVRDKKTLQSAIEKLSKSNNPNVFGAEYFSEFGVR